MGARSARGSLTATLSDGHSPGEVYKIDQTIGKTSKVITISYHAASAGQKLIIRYTIDKLYPDKHSWISLEAATLQGNGAKITGTSNIVNSYVNLSSEGTIDWMHWGRTDATTIDRKANVTPPKISLFKPLDKTNPSPTNINGSYFSWNDGTPVEFVDNTNTGLRVFRVDRGFEFYVPASLSPRTLKIYLGAKAAAGIFEASVNNAYYSTIINQTSGQSNHVITLNFQSEYKNSNTYLRVRYRVGTNYLPDFKSRITLSAATLSE